MRTIYVPFQSIVENEGKGIIRRELTNLNMNREKRAYITPVSTIIAYIHTFVDIHREVEFLNSLQKRLLVFIFGYTASSVIRLRRRRKRICIIIINASTNISIVINCSCIDFRTVVKLSYILK